MSTCIEEFLPESHLSGVSQCVTLDKLLKGQEKHTEPALWVLCSNAFHDDIGIFVVSYGVSHSGVCESSLPGMSGFVRAFPDLPHHRA